MKKPLLLQLILLISAVTTTNQDPPGLPFNVYGYVVDETGAPVADAHVAVNSTMDQKVTRSDSFGRYVATISIRGAGDPITVVAQMGNASGTESSTVPKSSSNLMINVTIPLAEWEGSSTRTTATAVQAEPWSFFLPVAVVVIILAALIVAIGRSTAKRRPIVSKSPEP